MKAFKYFMGALALCTLALVSCEEEKKGPTIDVDESAQPEIDAVEGAYVLVVKFDVAPCNDVVLAGHYVNEAGETVNWSEPYAKFSAIDGYPGWYKIVVKAVEGGVNDSNIPAAVAKGKPVQLKADGTFAWDHQWARNSAELLDGVCEMGDENNGEQYVAFTAESTVAYVKSTGWATDPCAAAIPAGNHEWIVQLSDTCQAVPADAQVIFTGNFTEKSWGESDRIMTKDGNVWKWTGDYPENFQAKAICVTADGVQHWATGGNYAFDGENYTYVVPSWENL